MSSVACVCVSICLSLYARVCYALTLESLKPESSLLVCGYIFGIFRSDSYVSADLHWLVKYRIQYKVAVTVYKILTTQEPSYLTDVIRFHVPSRHLRSCNRNLLQKDRTNLVFTDRSFSQAAPTVWNNLPQHVTSDLPNLSSFKQLLKTELCNRAYYC